MSLKQKLTSVFHSTAFRLIAWYAGVLVIISTLTLLSLLLAIEHILSQRVDDDLREDVAEMRQTYQRGGLPAVEQDIKREVSESERHSVFIRVLSDEGRQLLASDLSTWPDVRQLDKRISSIRYRDEVQLDTLESNNRDADTRYIIARLGKFLVVQIGESMQETDELLDIILSVVGLMFLLVLMLATPFGWLMARRALRGIEEVSDAALDIANGVLERRVTMHSSGNEIHRLISTFNSMAERNYSLLSGMREMTDNIAHDLRSPLTRIRAVAEMAMADKPDIKICNQALADTLEECDRLIKMVNTMLDVAEVEAGSANLTMQETDLSALVQDVCELFEPIAEDKNIEFTQRIEPDCRVTGNNSHLQRLFANLIDNALKYTEPGGQVVVEIAGEGSSVMFSIRDTGIGISEQDQIRVFRRFFRADESRSREGCGLGLNLARAIARAHGGDITLSSVLGTGSEFRVILPA